MSKTAKSQHQEPLISAKTVLPEITFKVIVLSIILAAATPSPADAAV